MSLSYSYTHLCYSPVQFCFYLSYLFLLLRTSLRKLYWLFYSLNIQIWNVILLNMSQLCIWIWLKKDLQCSQRINKVWPNPFSILFLQKFCKSRNVSCINCSRQTLTRTFRDQPQPRAFHRKLGRGDQVLSLLLQSLELSRKDV